MTTVHSKCSLTLDLPPSCIAFSPRYPEYFVIGTYFLHPGSTSDSDDNDAKIEREDHDVGDEDAASTIEQAQQRTGSLIMFRVGEGGDEM